MTERTGEEVPGPRPAWTSPLFTAFVLGMLAFVHGTLVIDTLLQKSITLDEIVHLPAGLTYLDKGTYRLLPLNPPLARLLAGAAASTLRPDLTGAYGSPSWKSDPPFFWQFGFRFMLDSTRTPEAAERYLALFTRGRLAIAALSMLTLPLLFWWGSWWFSREAGFAAAALWAFCPNVVAHAGVTTTDVAYTSFALLAAFLFARLLARPGLPAALAAGVGLGLAQLCKHSALWLWPLLGLWGLFALSRRVPTARRLAALAALVAVLLGACLLTVNAVYRFEGSGKPLGDYVFLSKALTRAGNDGTRVNRFRGTLLDRLPVPLPFYYVAGLDGLKMEDETGYQTYLNGETRRSGFRAYFLWALLLKLPLGTFAILLLAALAALRSRGAEGALNLDRLVPLLLLSAGPLFFLSFTNANLGIRYALPILPFLFLLAGTAARPGSPLGWNVALGAALVWNASALARIHPNELAYFNELSGGPARGRFHLIDSNLDWGQDLGTLSRWLDGNPDWKRDVRLAYAGNLSPEVEGIAPYRLAPRDIRVVPEPRRLPWERLDDLWSWGPQPGKFAVSVNLERGLFFRSPLPRPLFAEVQAARPAAILPGTHLLSSPKDSYAYFQRLTPRILPEVGFSILLYEVSLEEANRLRRELSMPELPPP